MTVLIVLVALAVAFVLIRMWDEAGQPPEEEPHNGRDHEPPSAGTRLAIVLGALAVGFTLYVGIPLALHALEGGEDDGGHDFVEQVCAAVNRPDVTAALHDLCR